MWVNTLKSLLIAPSQPSRDGGTQEIIGYSATLIDPRRSWLTNERRNLSPYYAAAEILWYASGSDDVAMMTAYAPSYAGYAEADGKAFGAYGKRIHGLIDEAIRALKSDPDSRRVVVSLWAPDDITHGQGHPCPFDGGEDDPPVKDVPCTLSWTFLVRNGQLHMDVTMRSNDVWKGMPYDIFWNTLVQRVVANQLGIEVGRYFHHVTSMHLYDRNRAAAAQAVDCEIEPCGTLWCGSQDTFRDLKIASQAEWCARTSGNTSMQTSPLPVASHTLLTLCKDFLSGNVTTSPTIDPVMLQAAKQYKKAVKQ